MTLTRRHLDTLGIIVFRSSVLDRNPGRNQIYNVSGQKPLLVKHWHTVWHVILEPQLYYAEHWYVAYSYYAPVTLLPVWL